MSLISIGISFREFSPEKKKPFCTFKLKLWDVEVPIVSCIIPSNFIPLAILVSEILGVLLIDYSCAMTDRSKYMI